MKKSLRLRVATSNDIGQIQLLVSRAYKKWERVLQGVAPPVKADYQHNFLRNRFDLLLEGNALIGLVETRIEEDALVIVNVAVEPAHQGFGMGSLLMKHAETVARFIRLSAIRLYTNKLLVENLELYRHMGYVYSKEVTDLNGTTLVHLIKFLDLNVSNK